MVRAPGGQLITRIKTEAAAGKLLADAVNHSDRGLMQGIADLFQDYAPPNAKDYRDDVLVSPKLWPRATLGWAIAYNTELEKNPPKTWMDLCKPRIRPEEDRPGDRAVRRHDLDPHHVRAPDASARITGRSRRRRSRSSIRRARPHRRRAGARRMLDRACCSTTSPTSRSATARRSTSCSRRKACRSTSMRPASPRRRPTRTPPSCSSTGACPRKGRRSRSRSSAI